MLQVNKATKVLFLEVLYKYRITKSISLLTESFTNLCLIIGTENVTYPLTTETTNLPREQNRIFEVYQDKRE